MKLVKSLLLGSAAGLAAVAGAQAADLPARKAAAVEYVRVCSAYGSGFFYIPGTETCLRVGGRVRADYIYAEPFSRADDALAFRARGRIQLDTRTQTAYGTLRAFVRMEMTQTGRGATSPNIAQAFVQFGGLTAGKVTSFFSNPDLPNANMGSLRFDDSPDIALAAYTFSFGNGFSATLSVEERGQRDVFEGAVIGGGFVGQPYTVVPGGTRMPDVVGNIRYAGTWGTAQLSGAVHQIRDAGIVSTTFGTGATAITIPGRAQLGVGGLPTGASLGEFADTDYGFAIGGSVGINLPMIGAGDAAWISAAYSQGASSYNGFGGLNAGPLAGDGFSTGVTDAVVNPFTGDLERTRVWNVAGGFTHYWIPTVRTSIFGSYARVEYPGASAVVVTTGTLAGATVGFADFSEWRVGGNTFWSPVSGLNIGVEVLYAQADPRNRIAVPVTFANGAPGTTRITGDVGRIEGRIRVQRDF